MISPRWAIHQEVDREVNQLLGRVLAQRHKDGRAIAIGAVKCLRPNGFPAHKAALNQLSYLALHRPKGHIFKAGKLPQIEAFVDVAHIGPT